MQERDNKWLKDRLDKLICSSFADVKFPNPVEVRFGRKTVTRFGSIRLTKAKISRILINGYFRNLLIPEKVVLATLVHELAHYVHGFSSMRPQLYRHPHKNGVVTRELTKRGLQYLEEFEGKWSKKNWHSFVEAEQGLEKLQKRRRARNVRRFRKIRIGISPISGLIEAFLRKYLQL